MEESAWTYEEALAWLYGRQALGIKLGLDKVRRLLAALDNPQDGFRSIHVAGTNGKGSVARFLAASLRGAGYKVGLTTSPHLVRFTERVEIDGRQVAPAAVAEALAAIRPHVAVLDEAGEPPTFFEVVTALAFLVFREEGVQWAVVETGMGGRLDATNVLEPALCVITNVSLDHAAFLGDHVGMIAAEKAGIMKPGIPCVTAATGDALAVLKVVSQALHVPMSILGEDYHIVADVNGMRLATPRGEAHYDVGPAGEHQLVNAALAVAAVDALRLAGVDVPDLAVHQALSNTVMPGRMETVQLSGAALAGADAPEGLVEMILDGAHNEAGAVALRRHLAKRQMSGFHLIVGFAADKPWESMLDQWAPLAAHVWGVPLRNSRSLPPAAIGRHLEGEFMPFDAAPDAATALHQAVAAGARQILVAGSLFLVGEARAAITGEPVEEIRGNQ